jgi:hypothetical protein
VQKYERGVNDLSATGRDSGLMSLQKCRLQGFYWENVMSLRSNMLRLGVAALALATAGAANAGTVRVFGERYNLNVINNFYNSYGGHTSQIISTLDAGSLAGVNLLWAVQPADAYTGSELSAMANFLAGGGRIAFMGEHGFFAPSENNRINSALSSLGATIQIQNLAPDAGFRSASVADGQIHPHALTTGVSTYQYACFAPLIVSGTAQVLMTGEDDPNQVMMAYQNIGAGSIFLITDQNVWDGSGSLWGAYDNETMFDNLVVAKTGAPPPPGVPESSTWAMMIAGFGAVGFAMRRRRNVAVRFA